MPATLAQRRRARLAKWGIGLPGNNDHILDVARRLQSRVTVPVLGGIAVYLHGYLRSTADLDFYTPDRRDTNEELLAAGARWDAGNREHVLDGVRIHTVTPDDAAHVVQRVSEIQGVRVVSLKDLLAIKLITGTRELGRAKDLGDVQELIPRSRWTRRSPASSRSTCGTTSSGWSMWCARPTRPAATSRGSDAVPRRDGE